MTAKNLNLELNEEELKIVSVALRTMMTYLTQRSNKSGDDLVLQALHSERKRFLKVLLKIEGKDTLVLDDGQKKSPQSFIITDPCYIMDEKQYNEICAQGADFESQKFPFASKHKETGQPITFHTIEGTPNGDGSYTYFGQDIGVDAGMLCIAENPLGWSGEKFGAIFSTLETAQDALPKIMKHF